MSAAIIKQMKGLKRYIGPQKPAVSFDAVQRINDVAHRLVKCTDANLRSLADHLRGRNENSGQREAMELGFALAVEAIRRTLGMRLYDVQLFAGLVMADGKIAEMQTGEGKTLSVAPVAFAHSLTGNGVHVATTNAYLAQRDYDELRDAYQLLGATVGLLDESGDSSASMHAYQQDITYGTGYQYGFDYLRDQLTISSEPRPVLGQSVIDALHGAKRRELKLLQRGLAFAIIDEIDSVLIDEAGTPLILSGGQDRKENPQAFQLAQYIANEFVEGRDFEIASTGKQIEIRAAGFEKIKQHQNRDLELSRPWASYVRNALYAKHCLERDVDYVVGDSQVKIVDQNTGRIFDDRTWRDGLHQAVEAKEELEISEAKSSLARVTRQRYFQRYQQICGLTGTATGNESEMRRFYGLDVQVVPPRKTNLRKVLPTRFFGNQTTKLQAIVEDVKARRVTGQPMLLGTRTISISKQLSALLAKNRLPHVLLNGIQDENESTIIAKAGHFNALTVATNMAGRGTDIKISSDGLKQGGLHVIGVEANFSARVDRQLFGRCARQGDPGSCQLFVAADDELIVASQHGLGKQIIRAAAGDGECRRDFSKEIFALQREMEHQGFEKRKELVRRDNWIDSVLETLNKEV